MSLEANKAFLPFGGLLSSAFWVAWITVVFCGDCIVAPRVNAFETTSIMLVGATLGMGISMVVGAIMPQRARESVCSPKAMIAVSLVCMVATYGVGFETYIPISLFYLCTFLSGATMGIIILRCAMLFSEVETRIASVFACMCAVAGVLVYTLFSLAAQFHSSLTVLILSGLLPVLGVASSFMEPANSETDLLHDKATEALTPTFWRVVAFMSIIAFALSLVRGFYPRMIDPVQFAGSRCDAALILILVFMIVAGVEITRTNKTTFGNFFYMLFMIAVAIMVPVVILGAYSSMSGSLATVSKGLLLLASWSFLSLWCYKTGMSAFRVFGFGYGFIMLATFLGYALGDAGGKMISFSYSALFESIMLLVCVLVAVVLLRIRDLQNVFTPTTAMVDSVEPDDFTQPDIAVVASTSSKKPARFKIRCSMIAESYELTPREADVFFLLAKHMEVKAIADELCVSFNTARTHVRHIYAKLNVHNRRELDDLIDLFEID